MAKKLAPIDLYSSSAAYDLSEYRNRGYDGSTAPEISRPSLPEEQRKPERKRRVRAKTTVAPFAVAGMAVVACMLILVIFGYVQLYEVTQQVSTLSTELSELQEDQAILESLYEGSIDLEYVQERAGELGFSNPTNEQTVYVNLSGSDRAEIYETEHVSLLERIIQAIRSSASGLVEYLS